MSSNSEVQKAWEEFWKSIVTNEDGSVNLEQVKRELSDYYFVLNEVPKVYCHITGDTLSKPNYYAKDVIQEADEHYNSIIGETFKDDIMDVINDENMSSDEKIEEIKKYLNE